MSSPPAPHRPPQPSDCRGTLRVYLGAAPGVGKTYAMLAEGRRRRERGTDVVIGWVETHGRAQTAAAVGDLEVVPRAVVGHRETDQEEMDLAAILARHPQVVLVDELAHTNVPRPGGNEKRWQDVEQLLAAGIHVITTVNIQHLESLNDVTEQITGIRQRETVPDAVVRAADQIELVDMSPQALRRRMAHGNVYAPAKVDAALTHYFREGNLAALRELALLWLADRVEEHLEQYRTDHGIRGTWATRGRIVVALSGGDESVALMRRAARIAGRRSGGEWTALYVNRHDGLSGVAADRLNELRERAAALGGSFHAVLGDDVAAAVLDFARAENASQVIIGVSRRSRLSTLLRPGVGEQVVAGAGEVDVLLVTHDQARRGHRFRPPAGLSRRRQLLGYLFALLAPWVLTAALTATDSFHGLPSEAMALMAVVVATALIGGLLPAILAALLSGMLLNWFFTPPLRTLTISEPGNIVAVALFILVGISVATVVDHSARRTAQARRARAEADALTVLSHSLLNSSDDLPGLLASACDLFGARGATVQRRTSSGIEVVAQAGDVASGEGASGTDRVETAIDSETTLVLVGANHTSSERALLHAYAAYAKVMEERQEARAARTEREQLQAADRTRTALLRAVSHDLRSPLAAVQAAISSLRSTDVHFDEADRAALLETIDVSAERLGLLVANLLDMSRIHAGAVATRPERVDVAEAVHWAVQALMTDPHPADRIDVQVPPGTVALADPGLLERVLVNLLENAAKYSPGTIRVDAATVEAVAVEGAPVDARLDPRVTIRVVDTGPGVSPVERDRMFAPFQRLDDVPTRSGVTDGVGLGLAVARGLSEAQDGSLTIEDTPGGGLTFVIELPAPSSEERQHP